MSNHEDLRAELDALLAERERAAPLVAAAKAYAEAVEATRAVHPAWELIGSSTIPLDAAWAMLEPQSAALRAHSEAARQFDAAHACLDAILRGES